MISWKPLVVPAGLVLSTSAPCFATTYFTIEQAQKAMFPGAAMSRFEVNLSAEKRQQIQQASDVRLRKEPQVWRVAGGGWFIVDEVLGKHEFITFAVALTAAGAVRQIEIMDYRESYGDAVREAKWRAQFQGKTAQARLRLDEDIQNISGATLSSRHVTEGVRRVLALYEAVLR